MHHLAFVNLWWLCSALHSSNVSNAWGWCVLPSLCPSVTLRSQTSQPLLLYTQLPVITALSNTTFISTQRPVILLSGLIVQSRAEMAHVWKLWCAWFNFSEKRRQMSLWSCHYCCRLYQTFVCLVYDLCSLCSEVSETSVVAPGPSHHILLWCHAGTPHKIVIHKLCL